MIDEFIEEEDSFDVANLPPFYANKLNGFLRSACAQGYLTCVDVLISRGADVNHIDNKDKSTVLQVAISHGHTSVVEFLADKVNEKTREAAHAYLVDRRKRFDDAIGFLSKKGAVVKELTLPPRVETPPPRVTTPPPHAATHTPTQHVHVETATNTTPRKISTKDEGVNTSAENADASDEKGRELAALQKTYDELHMRYDQHRKETDDKSKETEDLIKNLTAQLERVSKELTSERENRHSIEEKLDRLDSELTQKMEEISSVKTERDAERRAKENAKRILSLDNMNMPIVKRNPLLDFADSKTKLPSGTRSSFDLTNFDIQGKGNRPQSITSNNNAQKSSKKEGSKDDMEIHIEDRVKFRVQRLVKRWESMTSV